MAGPLSSRSGLGIEPHAEWLARLVDDARQRVAGIREAQPLGGYTFSLGQPPPAGARVSAAFGGISTPDPRELAELRCQQAAFDQVAREIDKQNSWLALPALAPVATVLGLEGGGLLAAGLAGARRRSPPHDFRNPEPPRIIRGDNRYARAGMRAHAELDARVAQKPGWQPQLTTKNGNSVFRPDASLPARNPLRPESRRQLELKPNTPSGRRAAARAVKRYTEGTGNKTRAIFYDPKDYL